MAPGGRAAEHGVAHGPRGRAPRRIPPAGPVREGVPAPRRRRAVGLPVRARAASTAAGAACEQAACRAQQARRGHLDCRHVSGGEIGCRRGMRTEGSSVRKHQLAQMIVIGVIASAIGIALALSVNWFPTVASTQAEKIDTLFDVLLVVLGPDLRARARSSSCSRSWKFRMRPGQELEDGPPIHGNTRLEVVWTAHPGDLLVGAVRLRLRGPARHREEAQDRDHGQRHRAAVRLVVRLPGGQDRRQVVTDQLYLPEGALRRVPRAAPQGRHPRLLGPRVPHEDRRRARASPPSTASRRTGSATTRSCVPSSAGWDMRRCVRPCT